METAPYASYDPAIAMNFIGHYEGLRLKAYRCPGGVWTIGYGHTQGVKAGDTCTAEDAASWLIEDIADHQSRLARYVNMPVTEGQFIALTSIAFNIGVTRLLKSKLLRKLNTGDIRGAAKEFLDFDLSNGKRLPGLTKRRKAESDLFLDEYDDETD